MHWLIVYAQHSYSSYSCIIWHPQVNEFHTISLTVIPQSCAVALANEEHRVCTLLAKQTRFIASDSCRVMVGQIINIMHSKVAVHSVTVKSSRLQEMIQNAKPTDIEIIWIINSTTAMTNNWSETVVVTKTTQNKVCNRRLLKSTFKSPPTTTWRLSLIRLSIRVSLSANLSVISSFPSYGIYTLMKSTLWLPLSIRIAHSLLCMVITVTLTCKSDLHKIAQPQRVYPEEGLC